MKRSTIILLTATLLVGCESTGNPLIPSTPAPSADISAGNLQTCVLDGRAGAYCWGRARLLDLFSVPAEADVENESYEPTLIDVQVRLIDIEAGSSHACGRSGGNNGIYCWGSNSHGQLGRHADPTEEHPPGRVSSSLDFDTVTVGGSHTCGLADGKAYCWGNNFRKALGLGEGGPGYSVQPRAVAGGHRFSSIHTVNSASCGITASHRTYCWGALGTTSDYASPTLVPTDIQFRSFLPGIALCGLDTASDVYCWRLDALLQPVDWPIERPSWTSPPVMVEGLPEVQQIVTGARNLCALGVDGVAYCLGDNRYGQLGDGTTDSRITAAPVAGGHTFVQIAAGSAHACGLEADGDLYCWGDGNHGQLGIGETEFGYFSPVPIRVPLP